MIYYDTKTGNVLAFLNKVNAVHNIDFEAINENTKLDAAAHFITYTIGDGQLSNEAKKFLVDNFKWIKTISSSGNDERHPTTYGLAIEKAVTAYPNIEKGIRFNLTGNDEDIQNFIELIK